MGCEHFRSFLAGITFHMETNHKPLLAILSLKNLDELPQRIQHFLMEPKRFQFLISHVQGKRFTTADMFFRALKAAGAAHTSFHRCSYFYFTSEKQETDKILSQVSIHHKKIQIKHSQKCPRNFTGTFLGSLQ